VMIRYPTENTRVGVLVGFERRYSNGELIKNCIRLHIRQSLN
jgi:hypothetical protein